MLLFYSNLCCLNTFCFLSVSLPSYRQVDRDCDFLEQERIMDYSLLVGLHFRETSNSPITSQTRVQTPTGYFYSHLEFMFDRTIITKHFSRHFSE